MKKQNQVWLGGNGKTEYIIWADSPEEISDGYHTFKELYNHRHILTCHLLIQYRDIAFKTRKNQDKDEWEGWFIAGLNTKLGQISYHLPIEYWNMLPVQEIVYNDKYDGHSSFDVHNRLRRLLMEPEMGSEVSKDVLCDSPDSSGSIRDTGILAQEEK